MDPTQVVLSYTGHGAYLAGGEEDQLAEENGNQGVVILINAHFLKLVSPV